MRPTPLATPQPASDRVGWKLLVIPGVLALIYGMLSYISLVDQAFFYESMDIPVPEHEFLLWSWGGKNTAMLAVLLTGIVTRRRPIVGVSMLMLFVGQLGDINAGAQSSTNVFITWIALTLVAIETALLLRSARGDTTPSAPAASGRESVEVSA